MVILTRFILPEFLAFVLNLTLGVFFVIIPIINHFGIFIAIRRHNNQVADAVSGQNVSILFRREKKAAIDMIIVIAVLMLCLAPAVVVNLFESSFAAEEYELLYVWSVALMYINSSINPVIYLVRNTEIRHAVRSTVRC